MIRYCTKCLYPDTKPDLWFDDKGVCSACVAYEGRAEVDFIGWSELGAVTALFVLASEKKPGTLFLCLNMN